MKRTIYHDMTICDFCGASKNGLSFVIGASQTLDWIMVEGTGKIACPLCWEKATAEGVAAVKRHTGL